MTGPAGSGGDDETRLFAVEGGVEGLPALDPVKRLVARRQPGFGGQMHRQILFRFRQRDSGHRIGGQIQNHQGVGLGADLGVDRCLMARLDHLGQRGGVHVLTDVFAEQRHRAPVDQRQQLFGILRRLDDSGIRSVEHARHQNGIAVGLRIGAEQMRSHPLEQGEEHQDQADGKRRRPHLLRREGARVVVGEGPHGKGGRGLNAHHRQQVGQDHHPGPHAADGRFLPQSGGELDHARNGEIGVVVAAAVPLGGAHRTGIGRQLRHAAAEHIPAADRIQRDGAGNHDSDGHQRALQRIDIGHRPQPAHGQIDQHGQGQQPHADILADQTVGQHVEQITRRVQLHAEIGDREQQRDQHRQQADCVAPEIIGQHLAGSQIAEALAEHPLALEKQHPGKRNGDGVEGRVGILEAVAIDQPRMAHEGPARKRRRRRRQDEQPKGQLATGDEEIGDRMHQLRAAHTGPHAITPVQGHKNEQPDDFRGHVGILPCGVPTPNSMPSVHLKVRE